MRALSCPTCGAPVSPPAHEVRVRCTHCGATIDVTAEGVAKVAQALQDAGIRVSPKLMTVDDIHAQIAEREVAKKASRRTTMILLGVMFTIFGIVGAAVAVAAQ